MGTKKYKAVGYTRVSTVEQALEGYSLENQRDDIEEYCRQKKMDLLGVFSDGGKSGASVIERIGLQNAIKVALEEKADYLIIWKVSRLSRSLVDVLNIVEKLEKKGVYLATIKENLNTRVGNDKFFLHFAGIFAQAERDNLIVQVKAGMKKKAKLGEWNGGAAPLGYDLIEKKLIVNEEEAKIVKLIFGMYLTGKGYSTILDKLNRLNMKTKLHIPKKPNGKVRGGIDFSTNSIKFILTNPTYKGVVRWGYRKDWGIKDEDNKRHRKYDKECIEVKGIHDAIISEDNFDKVQYMIKNNPRHHVKRFQGNHLLSGLLRCPDCGYGMSYQKVKSKGKVYEYYSCNQYQNKKTCKANMVNKDLIEDEFYNVLDNVLESTKVKDIMASEALNSETKIKEVLDAKRRKEEEITRLESEHERLIMMVRKGLFKSEEAIAAEINKITDNIDELKYSIAVDERKVRELQSEELNLENIREIIKNVTKALKVIEDKEAKQRLVRKLVKEIQLKDKHISSLELVIGDKIDVLGLSEEQRTLSQIVPNRLYDELFTDKIRFVMSMNCNKNNFIRLVV